MNFQTVCWIFSIVCRECHALLPSILICIINDIFIILCYFDVVLYSVVTSDIPQVSRLLFNMHVKTKTTRSPKLAGSHKWCISNQTCQPQTVLIAFFVGLSSCAVHTEVEQIYFAACKWSMERRVSLFSPESPIFLVLDVCTHSWA